MANTNWCVLQQGIYYLDWFRVGLWCPTRAAANAELRRLERLFPALKFKVAQSPQYPYGLYPRGARQPTASGARQAETRGTRHAAMPEARPVATREPQLRKARRS
jgi:hypothetical protein